MAQSSPTLSKEQLPTLPSKWHWSRIGDLVDQARGICYGIVQPGKHDPSGVPMVNSQDVNNGTVAARIDFRVTEKLHRRFKRSTIRGGEILLTLVGANFGRVAIAPSRLAGYNCSRAVGILPVEESSKYVMYCLQSPLTRHFLDNWANTTAQPTFNLKDAANLPIPLPPLPEQKAIAHILGSLDDKIELNRRMNATIEGMAQALFKSWFVDFDPVIDNALATGNPIPEELAERAEVRRKALADGTANREAAKQFPAAFQFTEELGWIPEGWEVKEFGSIAQNVRTPADPTTLPEDTPYVGLEHIDRQVFSLTRWGYAPDVDSQKSRFESSDFLFGKLRPYFHKVCQVQTGGICSTDILVIRPKENTYNGFVGCQIFEPEFVEYANLRSTGTRMPRASWKDMAKYEIALPAPQLIETFNNLVQPTREKCKRTVEESLTLTNLRDTLLPKLISCELRIPDVEKVMEIK